MTDNKKKTYEYDAVIQPADKGGAYVIFPYDIRKEFGKGRVKVRATFDGEPYEGSVVNMGMKNADGTVCYIIGVLKRIREKIGKQPGDSIHITITGQPDYSPDGFALRTGTHASPTNLPPPTR